MTTRERNAMQKFFNRLTEYDNERDRYFAELQELNAKNGDGSRWCSAEHNLHELEKTCKDERIINRAREAYRRYEQANGKLDLLHEFGFELAELNFWKHDRATL